MSFTLSGLARVEHCPASAVLRQTRKTTEFSSAGNCGHEFLQRVPKLGREEALRLAPEKHRPMLEPLPVEDLPLDPDLWAAEVSFAFNVRTGKARELGRGLNRNYVMLEDGEVAGTADVVGLLPDAAVIIDWKFGWQDLGPVRENAQLRAYALAACRTYDKRRALIGIIRPRDDEFFFEKAWLDEIDLDATEYSLQTTYDRVRALKERVAEGKAISTHEGPWCTNCPAFDDCPSKKALVRELALTTVENPSLLPDVLNDENASIALERLELAEQVIKRVREVIDDRARLSPIPCRNGFVYGEVKWPKTTIDADKALPIVASKVGPERAEKAVVVKKLITISALEDAARDALTASTGRPRGMGKLVKELLAELKEAGAAKTVYSPQLRHHKPRAGEQPALPEGEEAAP